MARQSSLILLFGLAGCIDGDAEVFLEARIEEPSAHVETSTLSTGLSGSFRVQFHLGRRAAEASEVTLTGFTVTDAARVGITDVEATTNPPFPVTVPINSDLGVGALFTAEDNLLELEAVDSLCAPAGIRIVGVFVDPLRGGSINAASEIFSPTGCP